MSTGAVAAVASDAPVGQIAPVEKLTPAPGGLYQSRTAASEGERNETESESGNLFDDMFGRLKTYFVGEEEKKEVHRGDGDVGAGHVGRYISLANPDKVSAL